MPAKTPGDREALEQQLTVHELRALHEVCRAFGVDAGEWHREEWIARYVESLAHARYSGQLQDSGVSRASADRLAAYSLGLEVDMLRSRQRRRRRS